MNVELTRALVETRTLAQDRGWERVAAAADAVLTSRPENALMLATPPGIEVGGLPRWIAETAPVLEIAKTSTEEIAANPLLSGEGERLVVVFECGKLVTADAVDVVQDICFSRPQGSYAIVLRGAENLESEEDLNLVERGVFRLFVPEPKGDWQGQDLLQSACYLWSDVQSPAFIAARLDRDKDALAAWLRRPIRHGDALAIQQALVTLEMADVEISQAPAPDAGQQPVPPTRLYATLNELTDVRQRLFARIDAEAPSIERQLTASLKTLEQDLLQGVHAYMAARLPHFDPSRDEARLTSVVTEYVASGSQAWKAKAESILAVRSEELQSDTDLILSDLDWKLVNAASQAAGGAADYPGTLLENLAQPQAANLPLGGPTTVDAFHPDRRKNPAVAICGMIAVAAIGQGVYMLGLGPIGLAAAGVTLVAQAVKYKDDSMRLCDEFARTAIQTTFRDTIQAVQQRVRDNLKPVRSRLADRFQDLETKLDHTLQSLRNAGGAAPADNPDRGTIEGLRQRIAALMADTGEEPTIVLHKAQ